MPKPAGKLRSSENPPVRGTDFGPLTPCANCRHRAEDHRVMGDCHKLDMRTGTGWCKCEAYVAAYKTGGS